MPLQLQATVTFSDQDIAALRQAILSEPPEAPTAVAARIPPTPFPGSGSIELPDRWPLVEERETDAYTWPGPDGPEREAYEPFRIYEGRTSEGTIRLAIGECERTNTWGRSRPYFITFALGTGGGSKRPLCEFLGTDDHEETGLMVAIIRGSDGGRKMYEPTASLPPAYNGLRVETYRDHIDYPGSWRKQAVVAHRDDADTMLAHSLIQAATRFNIRPS